MQKVHLLGKLHKACHNVNDIIWHLVIGMAVARARRRKPHNQACAGGLRSVQLGCSGEKPVSRSAKDATNQISAPMLAENPALAKQHCRQRKRLGKSRITLGID